MVAVLLHAADTLACVAGGVRDSFVVRNHVSAHDLLATLDDGDVTLVVVDAVDHAGRSMASTVTAIRRGFPTVPILAYCSLSTAPSAAVLDIARAGVTGLVFRGVDDARHAMHAAILAARQGSVTQRIQAEVAPYLREAARPLLSYAIGRAADNPTVDDAATTLGVDRKTLFNWFRNRGVAGPREFINWIRLAIAVGLLEDPRRTAEHVALELGFASGTSFRNMLHRYANASCSEIRAAGGLTRVLALFTSRLAVQVGDDSARAISLPERELRTPGETAARRGA